MYNSIYNIYIPVLKETFYNIVKSTSILFNNSKLYTSSGIQFRCINAKYIH